MSEIEWQVPTRDDLTSVMSEVKTTGLNRNERIEVYFNSDGKVIRWGKVQRGAYIEPPSCESVGAVIKNQWVSYADIIQQAEREIRTVVQNE